MTRARPRTLLKWLGSLFGLALLVGMVVLGVALVQSSMDVVHSDAADAERELDTIVARFGGQRPYVDLDRRDGRLTVAVHRELEPGAPDSIVTLHGVLWDAPRGRLVRASTPVWVFTVTRWKAQAAEGLVEPFERRLGLDVRLPDLTPLGPGLVLDQHAGDGRRIVIWTEGD